MRILCSGGAGYIGSTLVPELLRCGHKVTVLDLFLYEKNSLAHVCRDSNLTIVRGDVRDSSLMKRLLKDADCFIPLAALVGAPLCERNQYEAETVNYVAIKIAIKFMSKDQMILIPNTNSGYGIGDEVECNENSLLRPQSFYGVTKIAAERVVLDRGNAISFRLATVFGVSPRMRTDLLVNDMVLRAVKDRSVILFESHFRRNFIGIHDVASAFIDGIDNFEAMKDEIYNVGLSSANLTKMELCLRIKQHVPEFHILESPIGKDPDKRDYMVSNAKIEATGWQPQQSLDDGIQELIKFYQCIDQHQYGNI